MFGVAETRSIDTLEQDLLAPQAVVSRERARQTSFLRELDLGQVATADGSRSMVEWVASRLDVSHPVARDLMFLAKSTDSEVEGLLASGEVGWERALLMARLRLAGATDSEVTASQGYDLAGLERLVAARKRIANVTARFDDRYLVVQPNLDESVWRLWGLLAGVDGQVVEKALLARADECPPFGGRGPGGTVGGCFDVGLSRLPHRRFRGSGGDRGRSLRRRRPGRPHLRGSRSHPLVGSAGRTQLSLRDPLFRSGPDHLRR